MEAETILRDLSRRQLGRFIEGWHHRRETLGSHVHLYTFQERVVGALILSPSMGLVLYEAGKKVAAHIVHYFNDWVKSQPGYHALADAENVEEANLSGEIMGFKIIYKSNGVGLVNVVEYQKNKLIVVEVRECADCFDMDNIGKAVCYSIGGNIAGTLEVAVGRELGFVESKCCAKGDAYCEFRYTLS